MNQLYCGECALVMRTHLHDDSIDLTVTSPPYDDMRNYNGYVFDAEQVIKELYRVTKPGGIVVWIVADETRNGSETGTSFRQALHFMGSGFNLHDTMIWNKGKFSAVGTLSVRYASVFEYMFIFSKGKIKCFNPIRDRINKSAGGKVSGNIRQKDGSMKPMSNIGKVKKEYGQRFNIWEVCPQQGINEHPAPFPEQLARDHILSWSNEGDTVLDPMCGSGTTPKVASDLGRKYIGIDISQVYIDIAERRIAEAHLSDRMF